jgi:F0F1-type ATP synthase delta subunit
MIFSEYNKNNNNSINIMIQQVLEKYQYTPKIVFVSINKNLEKGAILKYKNLTIDLSLKRLYELLNKKITIHNIGEL